MTTLVETTEIRTTVEVWKSHKDSPGKPRIAAKKKLHKKKVKKPKYKKGSHKYRMYRRLKHARTPKSVKDFHETVLSNLLYTGKTTNRAYEFNTRMRKADINKLKAKPNESWIFLNLGHEMFRRVKVASYLKLSKLRKVAITFKCEVTYDGEYEPFELYEDITICHDIGHVYKTIHDMLAKEWAVYQTQLQCDWYSVYDFYSNVMTIDKDGVPKYYKYLDSFMDEYGII